MKNLDRWNRKDENPCVTVERIKRILCENNMDTHIVDSKSYGNYWASARVELNIFNGIGANGKGVGMNYTTASAYGELIERIQGNALVHYLFRVKDKNRTTHSRGLVEICVEKLRLFFSDATKKYSDEELSYMLEQYEDMRELAIYYNIAKRELVEIPERFMGFICGTNGIAAGNTYEEAFGQGICEIFERYIMKKIYSSNEFVWPTIPRQLYVKTNSFVMIQQIEKKGYTCIVKNCTMNGALPVVGVIVLDPSKTKCLFRLGSDLNFDLALQRCITEIFQGISFNVTFRMQMKSIFSVKNEASIWNYSDPTEGVTRAITDGSGIVPYTFLQGEESDDLTPFENRNYDNKIVQKKLVQIFKKLGKDLYIKDCSYLGFPTLHLFVPDISDAYYYTNNMDYLPVLRAIGQLGGTMGAYKNAKPIDVVEINEKLMNDLLTIRRYQTFRYNTTLNKFTGIYFHKEYPREIQDIDYVIGVLALSIRKFDIASEYLSSSYRLDSYIRNYTYEYVGIIVDAIANGIPKSEVIRTLKIFSVPDHVFELLHKLYDISINGWVMPTCNCCSECMYCDNCSYQEWEQLWTVLRNKELEFERKKPYTNAFFERLSNDMR